MSRAYSEHGVAASRPSILLTGFGAFPGVERNATAELIPELAEAARAQFPDHEVIGEVMPVHWSRAPMVLQELLSRAPARLALHFGVSHQVSGFQIELVSRNVCESRRDALGELPDCEHVIPSGPAILAATLPAERIIKRLSRAGFPCCTSNNAGSYLCNALLYHSLATARTRQTPFLAGFIHVPASLSGKACPAGEAESECGLSWSAAVAGSLEIIAACLDSAPA
jgi:pyroglutamyl-peptidase